VKLPLPPLRFWTLLQLWLSLRSEVKLLKELLLPLTLLSSLDEALSVAV
jgi:hypothetical protein